ncbi:phospholipid carrier-dependent glycosyltransferase [bacterium]|nr:MAG: phospholipid carrier-dependent glycosyltransferase [bacterium]
MTSKQKYLFFAVIIVAIFFRFYLIGQMPGGLFPDEAANGLDINMMENGQLQPFYERGNGREALFFYMLWGSVEVFDKGPWQHHIISALVGVLATIFTFYLTRRLLLLSGNDDDDEFTRRTNEERATWIALLAAFIMAASSWHVVLSRTAFRANLIPLFTTLTLFFLVATYQARSRAKRYWLAAATGASLALGFYTYIAYRIFVPVVAIVVLWPMLLDLWNGIRFKGKAPLNQAASAFSNRFAQIKKFFVPAVLAAVVFAAVIAPLAHYFYTHPGSFVGRSGQVSIFNPELNQGDLIGTLGQVTALSLKAYFADGDLNWRHNISGEPFLSIIISPFFLIGLIMATLRAARYTFMPGKHKKDWMYFLLAGWFWSMLIPVVTTAEGIPHGLRAIGTIPPVFIMAALGIWAVKERAEAIGHPYMMQISAWKQKLILSAVGVMYAAFVLALVSQTYIHYFVKAYNSPENFYAFRSDLTPVSEYLKSYGSKDDTYLILDKFSVQTTDYLTSDYGQPYKQVDPENSWELTGLKPGDKIIFTQSSIFDIKKFKQYHPNAALSQEIRNKFGQTVMALYVIK